MRPGPWLGAALFGLAGLCVAPAARAIGCNPPSSYCVSCGFALLRPLSGRVVSPQHEIDVVVSCYGSSGEILPSLWTDGNSLPSDWAPLGDTYFVGEVAYQRFRRRGPAFPAGANVALGTLGDDACQFARRADCSGDYSTVCASNPEVDCCARAADTTPTPLSSFAVASDLADMRGASPDAGLALAPPPAPTADAGAASALGAAASDDAGSASALDAGASHDAGALDAGAGVASPSTPRADTLPFEVRCTAGPRGTLLYLDVGEIDDSIVEVELAWSSADSAERLTWYAEPCLGQSSRRFDATLPGLSSTAASRPTLATGTSYTYEIRARTEAGPVADPETGTLLSEDCVEESDLGLTWQNGSFAVGCDEFDPNHTDSVAAELSMTVSPGSCLPEAPDEEPDLLEAPLVTTERHAPAPEVVSEPSTQIPSIAPSAPVAEPSPSSSGCSMGSLSGRSGGGFAWLLAGMVGGFVLVRTTRTLG